MNDFKHLFHQLPAIGAVCGERRQRNPLDRLPDLSKRVVDDGVSVGRFQARRSGEASKILGVQPIIAASYSGAIRTE